MMSLYAPADVQWEVRNIGSRVHALCDVGGGRILMGTRGLSDASIYENTNHGRGAWSLVTQLSASTGVAHIDWDGDDTYYALTIDSRLWKKVGAGAWTDMGVVSNNSPGPGTNTVSYGLFVSKVTGTVLVSDTKTGGGHVWRSPAGGEAFTDLGAVGSGLLFRFYDVGDGIVLNSWNGKLHKSTDDGLSWSQIANLTAVSTFAFLNLGGGHCLAGDDDGIIYETMNGWSSHAPVGSVAGSCDDLGDMGGGRILVCTWFSVKKAYFSDNFGRSWRAIGLAPTIVEGDFIERWLVSRDEADNVYALGAVNSGAVVRVILS